MENLNISQSSDAVGKTGKLFIRISDKKVDGYFLPMDGSPDGALKTVSAFTPDISLLESVENAIFAHPEFLEDCPVEIIIDTPEVILFPEGMSDDAVDAVMEKMYDADSDDYFISESDHGIQSAFYLCRRLKGFINRTFPGIPVHDQLSLFVSRHRVTGSGDRLYADVRDGRVDIVAFRGRNLMSAASHVCFAPEDMAYFIYMTWTKCGLDCEEGEVYISGETELKKSVTPVLRKCINYVRHAHVPVLPFNFEVPGVVSILYKKMI